MYNVISDFIYFCKTTYVYMTFRKILKFMTKMKGDIAFTMVTGLLCRCVL